MKKTSIFLIIILVFSCGKKAQLEADYIFVSSEVIEYFKNGNDKKQFVISSYPLLGELETDTVLIIQKYKSELLSEQLEYEIENTDSILSRHLIMEYDEKGKLICEIDSFVNRTYYKSKHYYDNNKEIRIERIHLWYQYDIEDAKAVISSVDTMKSIVSFYYNDQGYCLSSTSIDWNKDEMTNLLVEVIPDTSYMFHDYDDNGNRIGIITIEHGDTVAMTKMEYDKLNRETVILSISKEFGITSFQYEYDENGNKLSEVSVVGDSAERTEFTYNESNEVISKITYKSINTDINNN